jgi:uncharacterized membrane protein YdjX (TVP38/TMEM64 family)
MQGRSHSTRRIALGLSLLALLGLAAWLLPTKQWAIDFVRYVRGLGTLGFVLYGLAYVVGTVLLFPGTLLTLGSGFLYGPFWGTVLVSPASVAGATIAFVLARSFLRGWVSEQIQKYPRFTAVDRAVEKHSFRTVLLLRLQPVNLPFALLNYALGLTSVRLRDYVLASWVGMLPATTLYVYLGSAVRDLTGLLHGGASQAAGWQRLLFWGGLAATAILVVALTRLARRALQGELGEGHEANPPAGVRT